MTPPSGNLDVLPHHDFPKRRDAATMRQRAWWTRRTKEPHKPPWSSGNVHENGPGNYENYPPPEIRARQGGLSFNKALINHRFTWYLTEHIATLGWHSNTQDGSMGAWYIYRSMTSVDFYGMNLVGSYTVRPMDLGHCLVSGPGIPIFMAYWNNYIHPLYTAPYSSISSPIYPL